METDLPIDHRIIIPGAELDVAVSRASGPGGQHVNKTSSRVSLRWNIAETTALTDEEKARVLERLRHRLVGESEILIHVESERSQLQNRRIARERLVKLIKDALAVKRKRIATKPTARSKTKRIESKKLRGLIKKLRRRAND
jgi:ribosome-associated protein